MKNLVVCLLAVAGCGSEGPAALDGAITTDGQTGDLATDAPTDGSTDAVASRHLALGGLHSCVLGAAGGIRCWGRNMDGELGDGTITNRATPVAVSGGPYLAVSAGNYHTCAITSARRAVCWGRNATRQLGDGSQTNRSQPTPVSGLPEQDVIAISAGGAGTCAILSGGQAWCWGDNTYGQLGDGSTTEHSAPVAVSGLANAQTIAASGSHVCATRTTGAAACWGWAYSGRLGNGENSVSAVYPAPVDLTTLLATTDETDVGGAFSCARLTTGRVECWGDNQYGQLGNGSQVNMSEPILVAGVLDIARISTADAATCALATTGVVRCWGRNRSGQIGNGNGGVGQVVLSPSVVMGLPAAIDDLDSAFAHSCARTPTGTVLCWGDNTYGQIGDGSVNTERNVATAVML